MPDDYPADNACPAVTFFSRVYHPFVHEKSGALDMSPKFRTWTAGKDYIVLVLSYVKKIFYLKDFSAYGRRASGAGADGDARRTALRGTAFNEDARDLYARDRERFIDEVERCVQESIEKQYVNEPGSSLRFTEYKPQHGAFRERILRRALAAKRAAREEAAANLAAKLGGVNDGGGGGGGAGGGGGGGGGGELPETVVKALRRRRTSSGGLSPGGNPLNEAAHAREESRTRADTESDAYTTSISPQVSPVQTTKRRLPEQAAAAHEPGQATLARRASAGTFEDAESDGEQDGDAV